MSKHFNKGVVWGRVADTKRDTSEGGTLYLSITMETPNELYGNVKTYGRLWGDEKIAAFEDHLKKNPGATYRFEGFFSQYTKKDARYSNYTFFQWQQVSGAEFRAAFVLTGVVQYVSGDLLGLHLVREGTNGRKDTEEDFEVYAHDLQKLAGVQEGDTVTVKGVLRYKDTEDYYGGAPEGPVRPYCMDVKLHQPDKAPAESTSTEAY